MRRTPKAVTALAMAMMAVPVLRLSAAAPLPDVYVKTTIANTGDGVPLRVESDGRGTYQTTTVGKAQTVTSVIYSFDAGQGAIGTDFFLTTYYTSKNTYMASGRTALIDLSEQAAPGGFSAPTLGTGQVPVQFGVKCRLATPSPVNLLAMTAGTSVECPGSLRFWAPSGDWYRLSFQPENFSTSDRWKVTCDTSISSGCTKWTITPSTVQTTGADPNAKSVNTLLKINSNGDILAVGGDYYLSFFITVAR